MTNFVGLLRGAVRNKPISEQLKRVLDSEAQAAAADTIQITLGGQYSPGEGIRLAGSTRHHRKDPFFDSAKGGCGKGKRLSSRKPAQQCRHSISECSSRRKSEYKAGK